MSSESVRVRESVREGPVDGRAGDGWPGEEEVGVRHGLSRRTSAGSREKERTTHGAMTDPEPTHGSGRGRADVRDVEGVRCPEGFSSVPNASYSLVEVDALPFEMMERSKRGSEIVPPFKDEEDEGKTAATSGPVSAAAYFAASARTVAARSSIAERVRESGKKERKKGVATGDLRLRSRDVSRSPGSMLCGGCAVLCLALLRELRRSVSREIR